MKKINDRLTRRPTFKGQTFKGKSITIPGQDYTAAEIVRRFVQPAGKPGHFYSDLPLNSLQKLSKVEQLDAQLNLTKQKLSLQQNAEQLQKKQKQQTQSTAAKNVTTTNDDAK